MLEMPIHIKDIESWNGMHAYSIGCLEVTLMQYDDAWTNMWMINVILGQQVNMRKILS